MSAKVVELFKRQCSECKTWHRWKKRAPRRCRLCMKSFSYKPDVRSREITIEYQTVER